MPIDLVKGGMLHKRLEPFIKKFDQAMALFGKKVKIYVAAETTILVLTAPKLIQSILQPNEWFKFN